MAAPEAMALPVKLQEREKLTMTSFILLSIFLVLPFGDLLTIAEAEI